MRGQLECLWWQFALAIALGGLFVAGGGWYLNWARLVRCRDYAAMSYTLRR